MARLLPRPRLAFLFLLLLTPFAASAQDGRQFFEDNCAMCHNIGGEPSAGPDLKDISKRRDERWLVRFIRDPHEAAEHNREAAALVRQYDDAMPPTEGASREMLAAVVRYIDQRSRGDVIAAPAPAAATPARPVTAQDIALGRDLYEGRRALTNRAPACVSCHSVAALSAFGGGVFGPDLTIVHNKLGGTRGLTTWLSNPPTPVMRAVYRNAALSADETHALTAFFEQSAQSGAPAAPPRQSEFFLIVLGVVAVLLIAMGAVWSRRFRAVRRPLVERARAQAGGRL